VDGVRVEIVELDAAGARQIGPRQRATELLSERRGDIESAVGEACGIVQDSAAKLDERHGWRVSTLEAKFALTLSAEAGVIVSRASAEASFEITVTIERA
jgi:Trypsin-co-occurring domain 1